MIAMGIFSHEATPTPFSAQRPWETPRAVGLMLTLLPMLRSRLPRRNRPPRQEWNLPQGCVMAVRYRSR
jgi:hypothetical protein